MKYPVAEIFHSIQGEGHFVGYPMTFIRFAGCSVLDCHIRKECDEAPWNATERLTAAEVVARAQNVGPRSAPARAGSGLAGIACLTGGEPTDHDLIPIVAGLDQAGFRVHIETSGVRQFEGFPFEWITVSPKTPQFARRTGHVLKVIVRPEWDNPWPFINEYTAGTEFFHRYLQPLYAPDGRPINLQQVVEMVTARDVNATARWALSTQAHKTWGVR